MSRSALQKEFLKKQQSHQQVMVQQSAEAAMLQLQQQQQQQYYMQYQQGMMMGMPMPPMNMQMGMPVPMPAESMHPSGFVPIPLTGDEEDNEGPQGAKSNALPVYGNSSNYNINNLLFNNIMENDYFRALYQLRTYHEVIDEVYRTVDHVEPWQMGTTRLPSSAFCLLVKFMLMKVTLKQMKGLLGTKDCTNVRAIGLLYLRYTCPPTELWKWYEPYLEDAEEFQPAADKTIRMTVGQFCIKLLTDMQYFGTTLPRIPVPIERKMKVLLLLLEEKKKRRRNNLRDQDRGLFCVGAKVRAIYSDDANEPAWYEAVIDSKADDADGTGIDRYWVTFPEYGNSECVDLGDMELLSPTSSTSGGGGTGAGAGAGGGRSNSSSSGDRDKDRGMERERESGEVSERDRGSSYRGRDRERSRSRDRGSRDDSRDRHRDRDRDRDRDRGSRDDSRDRHRDRDRDRDRDRGSRDRSDGGLYSSAGGASNSASSGSLLEKVLQSQREASAAVGRNYGQRPTSYKGSMALKVDRYTARKKSPSPDRGGGRGGGGGGGGSSSRRSRSRSRDRSHHNSGRSSGGGGGSSYSTSNGSGGGGSRADSERLKQLKSRYGDASVSGGP
jgi:pre-mRNA-splicing factor 38B